MTPEKLRYAQHLMADKSRSISSFCRELGIIPASTLYHYLYADDTPEKSAQALLKQLQKSFF